MSAGDWKLRAPQRGLSDSQSNCSPPVHTTTVGPEDPLCCLLLTPVSAVCFSHPCQLCFSHQCQLSVSHTSVSLSHLCQLFLTPVSAVCFSHQRQLFPTPVSAVYFSHQCQLSVSHTSVSCLFLTPVQPSVSQSGVSCLFLTPMLAASDGSYRLNCLSQ